MFENLTQREKVLALAVLCLLPMMLLVTGLITFNNWYKTGRTSLMSLDNQIKTEKQRALNAISSGTRRSFYYKTISFPTNSENITRYQDWLEKLIRDCEMDFTSIARPKSSNFSFRSETGQGLSVIGKKLDFNFDATGSLDKIMKFCYEFDQIDLMHKIKQLSLTPKIDKGVLTGDCKAVFHVELLSLVDADASRDFLARKRKLPLSMDQYQQIVVSRNIFGPANNAPTLSLTKKTFEAGDEVSISLAGRDKDGDDLTYKLLDNGGIEGAKIVSRDGSNRATFECPPLDIGEYEFKVAVSDNGFPSKSAEAIGKIVFKEKSAPPPDPPPDPPFKHIGDTQINRISSRNGVFETKIRIRTTGEVFELKVGDEFELDEKSWKVRDIQIRRVTLESDGQILEFKQGDFLDKPRKTTEIANTDVADAAAAKGSRP